MTEMNLPQVKPMKIYVDNQGYEALVLQDRISERSKHIDIKFHFVKDLVQKKQSVLQYIPTNEMPADMFTKPLVTNKHDANVRRIGM